jgi:hypothetical protein
VTTIRASNKLRLWMPTAKNYKSGDCNTARNRRSSIVISRPSE